MNKTWAVTLAVSAMSAAGCGAATGRNAAGVQTSRFDAPFYDLSTWQTRELEASVTVRMPASSAYEITCDDNVSLFRREVPGAIGHKCTGSSSSERLPMWFATLDLPPGVAFAHAQSELCKEIMGNFGFEPTVCDRPFNNGALRVGFDESDFRPAHERSELWRVQLRFDDNRVLFALINIEQGDAADAFANRVFDAISASATLPQSETPLAWAPLADFDPRMQVEMPEGYARENRSMGAPWAERVWAFDSATARVRFDVTAFSSPLGAGIDGWDAAGHQRKLQERCTEEEAHLQSCAVSADEAGWPFMESERELAPGVVRRERSTYVHGYEWTVGVMGSREVAQSADASRFLLSLKIVERPVDPAAAPARTRPRSRATRTR